MDCEHREYVGDGIETSDEDELMVFGAGFCGTAALPFMNAEQRPLCHIALEDGLQDPFCGRPDGTEETCELVRKIDQVG